MVAVILKELSENFGRRRFLLIEGIIFFAALWAGYVTVRTVRGETGQDSPELVFLQVFTAGSDVLPSLLFFISFFGPLIGITLGFDAINSERIQGTLARTLSQPIYRDTLYNGKFLAGVITITVIIGSVVLLVIGLGMTILEFAPGQEALLRILFFTLATVIYMSFWLAVAMLCSVWFRSAVASALTAIALWLFFGFVVLMIAGAVADVMVADTSTTEGALQQIRIQQMVQRVSPVTLFQEATSALLSPTTRSLGPILVQQVEGLQSVRPLAISQSLLLVWPHLVAIVALTGLSFGISYLRFLREEVRA